MSLVNPRLYLGSYNEAHSLSWLSTHKVTHIVNCAKEIPAFYPDSFQYLCLNLDDVPEQNIHLALDISHKYISSALKNPSSIVFVHCMMGISRSATMVIHHLMAESKLSYEEVYRRVRAKRDIIHPNVGFVKQIKNRYPSPRATDVPFS